MRLSATDRLAVWVLIVNVTAGTLGADKGLPRPWRLLFWRAAC
jgi:hypothetical protein